MLFESIFPRHGFFTNFTADIRHFGLKNEVLQEMYRYKMGELYPLIKNITGKNWDDSDPSYYDIMNIDGFIGRKNGWLVMKYI